jgi:hypothetical protein
MTSDAYLTAEARAWVEIDRQLLGCEGVAHDEWQAFEDSLDE